MIVPDSSEVDRVLPSQALGDLLARADFIVITLGRAPGTRKMIDDRELGLLKPTAYLINVGRGDVIDEPALVGAHQEGRPAGACLDVFAVERFPPRASST